MMRRPLLLVLLLAGGPAFSQEWRIAPEYDVLLTSFDIQPPDIHLKAGEPVRLRFVNTSNQAHSFSAPGFFRAARLRERDTRLVEGGTLVVASLSTETIALVPQAGRYGAQSRNLFHRLLGMSGHIVVE